MPREDIPSTTPVLARMREGLAAFARWKNYMDRVVDMISDSGTKRKILSREGNRWTVERITKDGAKSNEAMDALEPGRNFPIAEIILDDGTSVSREMFAMEEIIFFHNEIKERARGLLRTQGEAMLAELPSPMPGPMVLGERYVSRFSLPPTDDPKQQELAIFTVGLELGKLLAFRILEGTGKGQDVASYEAALEGDPAFNTTSSVTLRRIMRHTREYQRRLEEQTPKTGQSVIEGQS